MKLQLQYNKDVQHEAKATCLHGASIFMWLQQINSWQLPHHKYTCYILPQSIGSIKPAGLFVVFTSDVDIKQLQLLETYTKVGQKLYIPCNTILLPQVHETELNEKLLWDIQVYHPSIGLVGFELGNSISIENLFDYLQDEKTDWGYANPGNKARPKLELLLLVSPSVEEIIDDLKADIGQKN
jgi:MoxR-vWA-beta-propeller ternary system domain bpX3